MNISLPLDDSYISACRNFIIFAYFAILMTSNETIKRSVSFLSMHNDKLYKSVFLSLYTRRNSSARDFVSSPVGHL